MFEHTTTKMSELHDDVKRTDRLAKNWFEMNQTFQLYFEWVIFHGLIKRLSKSSWIIWTVYSHTESFESLSYCCFKHDKATFRTKEQWIKWIFRLPTINKNKLLKLSDEEAQFPVMKIFAACEWLYTAGKDILVSKH